MVVVGVEYLIALGLMQKLSSGKDMVSFLELFALGGKLQSRLNEACVDAVVVRHSLSEGISRFGGFFEQVDLSGEEHVRCARGVTLSGLKDRFLAYLPLDVLEVMSEMLG